MIVNFVHAFYAKCNRTVVILRVCLFYSLHGNDQVLVRISEYLHEIRISQAVIKEANRCSDFLEAVVRHSTGFKVPRGYG